METGFFQAERRSGGGIPGEKGKKTSSTVMKTAEGAPSRLSSLLSLCIPQYGIAEGRRGLGADILLRGVDESDDTGVRCKRRAGSVGRSVNDGLCTGERPKSQKYARPSRARAVAPFRGGATIQG